MSRLARFLLPLMLLMLAVNAAHAQGPVPAASAAQVTGCQEVTYSKQGVARRLKDCGIVNPQGDPETLARSILAGPARRSAMGMDSAQSTLAMTAVQPGDAATTVRFQQLYQGVPVFLGQALVQYSKSGNVDLIVNNTLPRLNVAVKPVVSAADAEQAATATTKGAASLRAPTKTSLVIYGDGITPELAWHVIHYTDNPPQDLHTMVSAQSGKVMAQWNAIWGDPKPAPRSGAAPPPSPNRRPSPLGVTVPLTTPTATPAGSALTYDPNPVQQTGDTALRDNAGQTTPALDAARVTLAINGLRDPIDGRYLLRGPAVDMTAPGVTGCTLAYQPGQAREASRIFNYTRNDDRFAEAVTYTAIDGVQAWFQSLGFTNVNNRSVPVNVHCFAADNSYYSDEDQALHFGDGGVNDAEDGDIVIHEYGHAVQANQVPGWGPSSDTEQRAMGEGFGDFLAAMYYVNQGSPTYLTGGRYCVGEWDATSYNPADSGNAGSGCLRWTNGRNENTGLDIGRYSGTPTEEHDDGRFWSATLTCVYEGMGADATARDKVMKLVLQSHFSIVPDSSNNAFEDAVGALLLADRNLFASANERTITHCAAERGLITLPDVPTPSVTYPTGGEYIAPSTPINITWNSQGAPAETTYTVEFSAQCRPQGDFFDSVENGMGGWLVSHTGGSADWRIVTGEAFSPTHSWFSPSQGEIVQQFLVTPPITVGNGSQLTFRHKYNLESGSTSAYDGGVVEISTNGTTWQDLGTRLTQDGYNATISANFESPIGGRRAFSGDSGGWVETRANLADFVGQRIQIRFQQADDRSLARDGWWIDDILIGVPTDQNWTAIGVTPAGASSIAWTTPSQTGLNYCVRVQGQAPDYNPSLWGQSGVFGVWSGPTPTATATATPIPTNTPTPTPSPTPTMTPMPTITPSPTPTCTFISVFRLYEKRADGSEVQLAGFAPGLFATRSVGTRNGITIFNTPRLNTPVSGESTFATLDLRTFYGGIDNGISEVSLIVPSGYRFVKSWCSDVTGAACQGPASGQSTTENLARIKFACNAAHEYRFYVERTSP